MDLKTNRNSDTEKNDSAACEYDDEMLNKDIPGMSSDDFRRFGKAVIDFVADYIDNIRDRRVLSDVKPGYLSPLLPSSAPEYPEPWQDVFADIERLIMPGVTHWQSPHFHGYYPTAQSFPAIVGELLSAGLGVVGFNWICSPACTELEVAVTDWLGRLFGLPDCFLHSAGHGGGGIIQGSASEASLVAVLSAREVAAKKLLEERPELGDLATARSKLVCYTSEQSNSSVWRAGLLSGFPMRKLPTDSSGSLRGDVLAKAIADDRRLGLRPCCVVATLGTTGTCAFDSLVELGEVCGDLSVEEGGIWLHVDAAYAGGALVCPEFRWMLQGVERCDSFDVNAHKWLQVNFDCSVMWLQRPQLLTESFSVEPVYLTRQDDGMPDYRHWQLPLGRRFRSLKLWFVLRCFGVQALQEGIRRHVHLARLFERLVREDERFEIVVPATMGLVAARIRGADGGERTKSLLASIEKRGNLLLTPAAVNGVSILRFVVCSRLTTAEDVHFAWREIRSQLSALDVRGKETTQVEQTQNVKACVGNGYHQDADKTAYRSR